jgi:RNA polymerase sigma-70 factor (ECF subfamily)
MPTAPAATPDFTALFERHRRELHVHCYRMLGSFDEAEDLTQETFTRAWRARERFEGRSSIRAWLYRIATNACLDALDRRARVPSENGEVPWLQPYPDELLEAIPDQDDEPDATVAARETIELAYLVAIQHLPPRSRAVLILRDVLGWSAKETATLLGMTVASANSALQRSRAALREHLPKQRLDPNAQERELLKHYIEATDRGDGEALADMMTRDARFSMPPQPGVWVGPQAIIDAWKQGGFGDPDWGEMRCVPVRANRQPAIAAYVRRAGDDTYRLFALDVLRLEHGRVAEIVTFSRKALDAFGLPATL